MQNLMSEEMAALRQKPIRCQSPRREFNMTSFTLWPRVWSRKIDINLNSSQYCSMYGNGGSSLYKLTLMSGDMTHCHFDIEELIIVTYFYEMISITHDSRGHKLVLGQIASKQKYLKSKVRKTRQIRKTIMLFQNGMVSGARRSKQTQSTCHIYRSTVLLKPVGFR